MIKFTFEDGSEAYLEHHGVKGMRWGVRRYQNEDGSLTAAGKRKKYTKEYNKQTRDLSKQYLKDRYKNRVEYVDTVNNAYIKKRKNASNLRFKATQKDATNYERYSKQMAKTMTKKQAAGRVAAKTAIALVGGGALGVAGTAIGRKYGQETVGLALGTVGPYALGYAIGKSMRGDVAALAGHTIYKTDNKKK